MAHAHDQGHDDHAPHHAPLNEGDDLPHHGPVLSEPRSPVWLPFLGAALAGVLLVWWLSMPSDAEEAANAAAASASASAAAAPEAPAGEPPQGAAPGAPPGAPKNLKVAPAAEINPRFKK